MSIEGSCRDAVFTYQFLDRFLEFLKIFNVALPLEGFHIAFRIPRRLVPPPGVWRSHDCGVESEGCPPEIAQKMQTASGALAAAW